MSTSPPVAEQNASRILSRRSFLVASAAAAAAGFVFYSNDIARHELEVTYPVFFIRDLPPAFHGFRIVQISDLHLEEYTEDHFLRRVIRRVNALRADMVLVTGDFISRGPLSPSVSLSAAGRCAEMLATLTCPLRFGILGNHDAAVGSRIVRGHMEANGLPILVNQHLPIERGGQQIYLAGVDDIAYGNPDLDLAIPDQPGAPVILMAHEPDYADEVVSHPRGKYVDLILSGHSHGGQVRLPGIGPLALPPLARNYVQGAFRLGEAQLYVNRGIGTVGVPFRLNCMPEITVATLQRPPNSS